MIIVIIPVGRCGFQQRHEYLRRKALPEFNHDGCTKRAHVAVFLQPEEVLEVRVFADVENRPFVAALQAPLDDASPSVVRRMRMNFVVYETLRVRRFCNAPWNEGCQPNLLIVGVKGHIRYKNRRMIVAEPYDTSSIIPSLHC